MKDRLVLFGAGERAKKFLCMYFPKKADLVFDNHKNGFFYGIKIERPRYIVNAFIIVACQYYLEVREQLLSLGYREFEDFIPEEIHGKKMAVMYGNCHAELVKRYLMRNKFLSREYGFYPFPEIQNMREDLDYENILPQCALFIDQAIRDSNRYGAKYASSAVANCLPETCKRVCIPNLYGLTKCFFPQSLGGGAAFSAYRETNIERWYLEGKSKEQIVEKLLQGGIYSREYIISLWEEFRDKLLMREEQWDIKISDYIFAHYKTEKLFNDPNHISSGLAKEIAARTLGYLGYETRIPYVIPALDGFEMFIYKDVKEALELEYEETYIRKYSRYLLMTETYVDLEEYVDQCYQGYAFLLSMDAEGK